MEKQTQRAPILSLTALDASSLEGGVVRADSRVLVVARRPATNPTHPNVISVPTQRLPLALYSAVLDSANLIGESDERAYFRGGAVENASVNGHHPIVFAVEALLARKLGLADALEHNRCPFRAALRAQVGGAALYDNLGPKSVYEPVSMLNVAIEMERPESLPLETSSYSMVAWTTVGSFLEGVERKDPARISDRLDPLEFCVHGVCLQAAQATLEHMLDQEPFPESPDTGLDPLMTAPYSSRFPQRT